MTISSTVRKAGPFDGTGSQTEFPFEFKVFSAGDLYVVQYNEVISVETVLELDSDYTVTLNADQDNDPGGTIELTSALAVNYTLTITSSLANLQPTDLTNRGGFYPSVINDALDRACIQIQQLQDETDRTLKTAVSVPDGIDNTLPMPAANMVIGWDNTGVALKNWSVNDLVTSVAYGSAKADIFTGDGETVDFYLELDPASINNLDVSVGGVCQVPVDDYTWTSGTKVTFTTAPPDGETVLIRYMQALPQGTVVWTSVYGRPFVDDVVYINQDTTITTAVNMLEGGMFYIASGKTLTINGPFSCGLFQCFSGAGSVVFGSGSVTEVVPQWWGAKGDGEHDDTAAIQAAINAAGYNKVFIPAGIYAVSKPIDIHGANVISSGTLRPTSTWAAATMSNGTLSKAIIYLSGQGASYEGVVISGSYVSIDGADANGVARADYCIEIGPATGQVSYVDVSNVKIGRAKVAGVWQNGSGYMVHWKNIHASALPTGFDSNSDGTGAYGPTIFENCYAVQCYTGFKLYNLAANLIDIGTDNCDVGMYFSKTASAKITNWNCENVYQPLSVYALSSVNIQSSFFSFLGKEATIEANSYSGQLGEGPQSPNYMVQFYESDIKIDSSCFYISPLVDAGSPQTAFDYLFAGGASPSTPEVDYSRVELNKCYAYYQYNPVTKGNKPRRGLSVTFTNFWTAYTPNLRDMDENYGTTYTVVAQGGTSAGTGTYTTQWCQCRKDNNTVHIQVNLGWSAHTGTGALLVTLPFAANNHAQVLTITADGLTYSGQLVAVIYPNSNLVQILSQSSSGSLSIVAIDTSVTSLHLSGTYFIP